MKSQDETNILYTMYYSDFWIRLYKKSREEIFNTNKIEKYNKLSIESKYITNIFDKASCLSKEEVIATIKKVSKVPEEERYIDGVLASQEYYEKLLENLNLENVEESGEVKYGITIKRADMRTFPTADRALKNKEEYAIDRFRESSVYSCEPCIIYNTSKDDRWYFCRTYNYYGWIKKEFIAVGKKEEIEAYCNSEDFIVVTGKKVYTGFNPLNMQVSNITLDMGVKLSINKSWDSGKLLDGMRTNRNYVVMYPSKKEDESLYFTNLLIPYNEDVHKGYLKCSIANILKEAFKLQGERYGWGGDFQGRDCSSLVLDIFRTLGLKLPRNSKDQLFNSVGKAIIFSENADRHVKMRIINGLKPGSLIFLEGHVVMVVGKYEDEIYVIHDTIGMFVENSNKEKEYIAVNGVTVSRLKDIYTSQGVAYIDAVIGTKEVFKY